MEWIRKLLARVKESNFVRWLKDKFNRASNVVRKHRLVYGSLALATVGTIGLATMSLPIAIAGLVIVAVGTILLSSYDAYLGLSRLLEFVTMLYAGLFWAAVIGAIISIGAIPELTIPMFLSWVGMAWVFTWLHNSFKRERFSQEAGHRMIREDGAQEPLNTKSLHKLKKYAKAAKRDIAKV